MIRLLATLCLAAVPVLAQASDVRVNVDGVRIQSGSTTIQFGDRDKRGYYWDGKTWRDPVYWDKNYGKGKGNQGCPPGQAKKGNC
ncbi:MAG: DUF2502 domain-containing protein [Betaproteobacteria bacterium]|nr:DUF2502 domain-containing protein [Betaproteobacteria bacterium]